MLAGHSAHRSGVLPQKFPEMTETVFWAGMAVALLGGLAVIAWQARHDKRTARELEESELAEEIEETLDPPE